MVNTNTLDNVVPQLLAQGLLALREMAVMARYVNRAYESMAGEKGSTIDVPIPSAITAATVTAANTPPDDAGTQPTKVSIALSNWYEAPFFLTDKEMLEVMSGTIPMQASEAVKALANQVDGDILALYADIYGYAGVAGSTPFASDASEFLAARKTLNEQLAPMSPRFVALDPDAEANALNLRAFQDVSYRGENAGIIEGQIGRKFGSTWFMDQLVPTHTAGTGASGTASGTAGNTTLTFDSAGTGTVLDGDVITIGTDTQTYVVSNAVGLDDISDGGTCTVAPALKTSPSSAAVTLKQSHVANLAFHRDAFALATRPFAGADPLGLGTFQSAVDPVSGLTLRLEVSRQYKRTRFAYDILYGVQTVRAALACRIAG